MPQELSLGGQAVIEGVLIKSKTKYAIAVRKPDKKIKVRLVKYTSLLNKYPILKIPFIRGVIVLFEMLKVGIEALTYSANEALEEDEQVSSWGLTLTLIFALAAGIGLFVLLPYALTHLTGIAEAQNPLLFNSIDGIIKFLLFVAYLLAIAQMNDVKRLFQYHGAEHKAVHCYEAQKPLTVKNVQSFTTIHPRCGTTFILLVLVLGIILLSFVPLVVRSFITLETLHIVVQKIILVCTRILFMLPVAGLSYEVLKLGGKYPKSVFMQPLIWPGMLVQKITTQKPDNKQVEVAIKAVQALVK